MWWATFSPDGSQVATADDEAAQIWDGQTHRLLFTLPHGAEVYQAFYAPDGTWLVTVTETTVKLWDAKTWSSRITTGAHAVHGRHHRLQRAHGEDGARRQRHRHTPHARPDPGGRAKKQRPAYMDKLVAASQAPIIAKQGTKVSDSGGLQVYSKVLSGSGRRAVLLLNRSASAAQLSVRFADIGLGASAAVRDVWAGSDLGNKDTSYSASVAANDSLLLLVTDAAGQK